MPQSIPVPPLSLHTYLQLEMSSQKPSPLYIHRSKTSDFPYESSRVKIERLLNFLLLPPQLEQVLWFGALACLDAWLYSFTILPLRFFKALSILGRSSSRNLATEIQSIIAFIYAGTGRMWRRRCRRESINGSANRNSVDDVPLAKELVSDMTPTNPAGKEGEYGADPRFEPMRKPRTIPALRRRTAKSMPSTLLPDHKADILKGLLIIISCIILMYLDASRMYHGIRGQAAIKLYVIYNVLEVCDRLFSALGQDVLECLFSKETLERKPDGRSKVWRPCWLFCLALGYNLVHSTALFYQVITLNVAVNSYSNALLTLLMSNQFVEIKSTVFKKFEKENLFQITCADVVERFQLWLMLMIIASRNIIETGGLSIGSSGGTGGGSASASSLGIPGMLPKSFTIFPEWTGQVMGPFFLVLGSEMLVDWIKHAYITKFNMTKPAIYGRFLDVLAKDYYSNAFADQNLTRRLGLPVIPLACLFIRASVQTYHMFLATHMPLPLPSTATSLSIENATSSPATTAAIQHIDQIFRRALGRSTFGAGGPSLSPNSRSLWDVDDIIACGTMLVFFLVLFLALLALKLVLGMCLLSFARRRYKGMKERESIPVHAEGKRVGGWGVIEVDDDKRRWIYMDDPEGARKLREREKAVKEQESRPRKEGGEPFAGVSRYNMVSKRIW
ncbi:transmembrane anterior posterior transformation protein 1, partial [Lecanoromycetidae sp. Uapishka_2]